jgi:hypothetical protein
VRGIPEYLRSDNVLTYKSSVFEICRYPQCSPCWPWASEFDGLRQAASTV